MRLTLVRFSSVGRAAFVAAGLESRTVCRRTSDLSPTSHTAISDSRWRHLYFDSGSTV